jgi:hypothetical protein
MVVIDMINSDGQTISGRPPPAASMAVGQFFNPDDGKRDLSAQFMLLSSHSQKVNVFLNTCTS